MPETPDNKVLIKAAYPYINTLREKTTDTINDALAYVFPNLQRFGEEEEEFPLYTDPNMFRTPRYLTLNPHVPVYNTNLYVSRIGIIDIYQKKTKKKIPVVNALIIECEKEKEYTGVELHAFVDGRVNSPRVLYRNFDLPTIIYSPQGDGNSDPTQIYDSPHDFRNDMAKRALEELALASFADQALYDVIGDGFFSRDRDRLAGLVKEWKAVNGLQKQLHPGITELIPYDRRDLFAPVVIFPQTKGK
jgi:hypothetical protein